MAEQGPFPAGTVDWSGENPGMYLKDPDSGEFVSLMSLFRVVMSPHGRGEGLILLEAPGHAGSSDEALNVCVTNNESLAQYLVDGFVRFFGPFRDQPGLNAIEYRHLDAITRGGDGRTRYSEHVAGEGIVADLSWEQLGDPFMVDLPPEESATGRHEMFSLFVDCNRAVATVNGRRIKGAAAPRQMAGRTTTTAFLAFSETWILP